MRSSKLYGAVLAVALLESQCMWAGVAGAGSAPTGATTCAIPYTFVVQGRKIYSGSCAGGLPVNPPAVTVAVGTRFRVRILHERNGALDYPVPIPGNNSVQRTGRHGATVYYRTTTVGTSRLIARHTQFCLSKNPKFANCAVLSVHVEPVVLHMKWRQVAANTTGGDSVATSDRYAAIRSCPGPASSCTPQLSVVDEQSGQQQVLAVPSSPVEGANESSAYDCSSSFMPAGFGGPYLAVGCTGDAHWLYNLNTQQWTPVTPKCPADCGFVGVGRYWLKFDSQSGASCPEHCRNNYFLQNLQTGQVEPDPAKPGGTTWDDLNAPSGIAPICTPLRYPTSQGNLGSELGSLQISHPYVLASGNVYSVREGLITVSHLERCGSRRALGAWHFHPLMSSRAVVFGSSHRIGGLYLRGLREFTASLPPVRVPPNSVPGEVVGLTRRTIYVQSTAIDRYGYSYPGAFWAATLPQQPGPRRH